MWRVLAETQYKYDKYTGQMVKDDIWHDDWGTIKFGIGFLICAGIWGWLKEIAEKKDGKDR